MPGAIALVVEPYLFVLADRHPRAWFVRIGTAAMAIGAVCAALASSAWLLGVSLGLLYVAIGVSSGLGQAALIDRAPDQRARTLARYTLLSLGGDLAAPALLVLVSWRGAYAICAALLAAWALALICTPLPERAAAPSTDVADDAPTGVLAALRDALADRALLLWLFATALCDLLDEIFVVLAALHLRLDHGASPLAASLAIAAFVLGGALGLALLDRLLAHRDDRQLLLRIAPACAIVYLGWLAAPTPIVAIALALPVGALAAPLYPLVSARAYALRPDATATVMAASHLFAPLGLALPLLLGVAADHIGTRYALALLAIEPLAIAALTWCTCRSTRRPRRATASS